MLKTRITLLSILALTIASGIAASPALAGGGPFFKVSGGILNGIKQIELQNKGNLVLKGTVVATVVTVECSVSSSEGATIEGGGQTPGQDKGRLKFTSCSTVAGGSGTACKVREPIKTNQTKSILGTSSETQKKYVDIYSTEQGAPFAELTFETNVGSCPINGVTVPVKGSVAAAISPGETEGQEGNLVFPASPIKKVQVFYQAGTQPQETELKLSVGANPAAVFSGFYTVKLVGGEPFGVFG